METKEKNFEQDIESWLLTEEELRREIEHQKQFFLEQHQKQED